jgi:hypothetical protein
MNARTQQRHERYLLQYEQAGSRLFYAAQNANTSSSGFSVNPFALTDEAAQEAIGVARRLLEAKRKYLDELESAIGEYDMATQNLGPELYKQKMISGE